jgi:hypothetical protein
MKTFWIVVVATLALAQNAFAQDTTQALGGAGESCRARVDCKAGFKCINQVCTDEHEGQTCGATSDCGLLRCIQNKCTSASAAAAAQTNASKPSGSSTDDWMKFNPLDGNAHPYVGITLAGGFDIGGVTGNFAGFFNNFKVVDGEFLFALNGGLYIGNHQLSFEIAPVTYVYDGKANGPIFEMVASYAYFVPLTEFGDVHVYWPFRFGVGMLAGPDVNIFGLAYLQARADLIGVAFQIGHAVIDLHLPSFRYAITDKSGTQIHILDWLFGVSAGYSF